MGKTTTTRLFVLSPHEVRPFPISLPRPEPYESLMGFLSRCFSRTVLRQLTQALTLAGIGALYPEALATTLKEEDNINGLATLLKTSDAEIRARLFRAGTLDNGKSAAIDFFGMLIRAPYYDPEARRVSPRALSASLYHRAIWDIRLFSFDPETKETLLEQCPSCERKLGWRRIHGPHMCEWCRDDEGLPIIDLRDYPQDVVSVEDEEALDFVTGIISPDISVRDQSFRKAHGGMWNSLSRSELFETIVSFACAMTMDATVPRTTLERPKAVESYKRFTPEVLAAAGRVVLDDRKGFTNLADRLRAEADKRKSHYGVRKELLPLSCMAVDQHLTKDTKAIIRAAVNTDMLRPETGVKLRVKFANNSKYSPIRVIAKERGLQTRVLMKLADSGLVQVIESKTSKSSPRLLEIAEVSPLIDLYDDRMLEINVAGCLSIGVEALPALLARGLISRIEGPARAMFDTDGPVYRASEVKALRARMLAVAKKAPPESLPMRISKSVKRLGMTPVPWGAVIAAIVTKKADVVTITGNNANWQTGLGTVDVRQFVRAVTSELCSADSFAMDKWIGNQTTAEILRCTEVFVSLLGKYGKLDRNGPHVHQLFEREQVEEFAQKYILVPEVMQRAGLSRARDVRSWLATRGVQVEFAMAKDNYLAFNREAAERVLGSP